MVKISTLTVAKAKNAVGAHDKHFYSVFKRNKEYSNLRPALTQFLNFFHFSFRDKLKVCAEAECLVQCVCNLFPAIQRHKSLLLNICEIHSFERVEDFVTSKFLV